MVSLALPSAAPTARSTLSDWPAGRPAAGRPGMLRLLQLLEFVVLRLGPARTRGRIVVQRDRDLAEGFAIRLDPRLAELLEFASQRLLGGADRVRRLGSSLLQDVLKDL